VVDTGIGDWAEFVVLVADCWEVVGTITKLFEVEEDQLLVMIFPEVVD